MNTKPISILSILYIDLDGLSLLSKGVLIVSLSLRVVQEPARQLAEIYPLSVFTVTEFINQGCTSEDGTEGKGSQS